MESAFVLPFAKGRDPGAASLFPCKASGINLWLPELAPAERIELHTIAMFALITFSARMKIAGER